MERRNAILKELLLKTCEESRSSLEIALQWVINAKNLLLNVHGFSPYQLVFCMNPRLPNVLSNRRLVLERLSGSKIVVSNSRSMHEARKAFIKCESSEKISHALRHNLRMYKDAIFTTGDVYYKRNDRKRWNVSGKVIGVDGQEILVKHGSFYVRCHPSHVILKDEDVRKRTLRSSHIAANSDAQDQSMNDNSTLDSDAQDRKVNNDNHTDSLQGSNDSDDSTKKVMIVIPSGQSCTASTDKVKEKENPTITDDKVLQKDARVAYKLFYGDQEKEATIIGCAGHVTG